MVQPRVAIDLRMEHNLPTQEVLRRVKDSLRGSDLTARTSAFYLAELADRQAWDEVGATDRDQFLQEWLGMSRSSFDEYVAVGRALRVRKKIDALFESERLNWSKVRKIAPKATEYTEDAWAAFALANDPDRVAREAAKREKGEPPKGERGLRLLEKKVRLVIVATVLVSQMFRRALAKAEAEGGTKLNALQFLSHLLQLYLRSEPDGSLRGWKPVRTEAYVIHAVVGEGDVGWSVDEDGEPFPFSLAELRASARKAHAGELAQGAVEEPAAPPEQQEAVQPPWPDPAVDPPPPIPETDFGDTSAIDPQNNGPCVPMEERDAPTSPALRDETLARDGWRCVSCGSRRDLQAHHLKWRRYGGATALSNLASLCIKCHSQVHARLLVILGQPGALCFHGSDGREIGFRPERPVVFWRGTAQVRAGEPERVETRLADLVGQGEVRARVGVVVEAAKARGEQPAHLLFSGPPGLGKTSLAEAVAGELGGAIVRAPAPHVQSPEALVRALRSVKPGGVLFMDEVHALGERCREVLYEAFDRGEVTVPGRGRCRCLRSPSWARPARRTSSRARCEVGWCESGCGTTHPGS